MSIIGPRQSSKTATYAAPKVTQYGGVAKLTANGTKSGAEGTGNSADKTMV